jgi:hypothetical protein
MATAPTGVGSTVFKGLKTPRSILEYNLMRGVTDFSNLEQYDLYEKGYPWLVVLKAPQFLLDLSDKNDEIAVLLNNFIHILESDFRGIDNVDNITGEANGEITNGIRSIQLINKVTQPGNSNFSRRYYERSGSVMTKLNELYLTGIKDKDTQAKTYHGLIDKYVFEGLETISGKDPGPHQEVWAFMYFVTDNTVTKIEKAFLIAAAQQTNAEFSQLYAGDKGDIAFTELNISFNGFFINNDQVSLAAQKMLLAMRHPDNMTGTKLIVDSTNFKYHQINEVNKSIEGNQEGMAENWTDQNGVMTAEGSTMAAKGTIGSIDPRSTDGAYFDIVGSMKGAEHYAQSFQFESNT